MSVAAWKRNAPAGARLRVVENTALPARTGSLNTLVRTTGSGITYLPDSGGDGRPETFPTKGATVNDAGQLVCPHPNARRAAEGHTVTFEIEEDGRG